MEGIFSKRREGFTHKENDFRRMIVKIRFFQLDKVNSCTMSNFAAWLPYKGSQLQLGPSDMPKPLPGEIVIKARIYN